MRTIATNVLVGAFITGLSLPLLSRVPELSSSAPLLLLAAVVLCLGAGTGLVLVSAGPRRTRS